VIVSVRMKWVAILGLAACAHHARPSHAPAARSDAPRIATFAPTAMRAEKTRVARRDEVVPRSKERDIVSAIQARGPSFHRCFEQALRADPALRSIKVPVRVKIGARGNVDFAAAAGGRARLDACVAAVVRRMSFPPGEPIVVEVPLLFTQS